MKNISILSRVGAIVLLGGLLSSCSSSDSRELTVNLGIPIKKPTVLESISELANIVPGDKCRQNNIFILVADQNNTVLYKKPIKLESSLTSNNSCTAINPDYSSSDDGIDSIINRLKECSWLTEEVTVDIPLGIQAQVGIAGSFYLPKDVNDDGICDAEELDYSPTSTYPEGNAWVMFDAFNSGRAYHTLTELNNGKILAFSGQKEPGVQSMSDTYEIYDPIQQAFVEKNFNEVNNVSLNPRSHHTATKLRDGRVVIIGGKDQNGNTSLSSIHIFNTDETWSNPNVPATFLSGITGHTASLIDANRILVIGGNVYPVGAPSSNSITQVGVLTVATNNTLSWQPLTPLPDARQEHTATIIGDYVYVIGGTQYMSGSIGSNLDDNILKLNFKSASAPWIAQDNLGNRWVNHTATRMPNNTISIVGGIDPVTSNSLGNFIFSPNNTIGTLLLLNNNFATTQPYETLLLPKGGLITFGSSSQLFDVNTGKWRPIATKLYNHPGLRALLYQGKKVISTGGVNYDGNGSQLNETFIFGHRFASRQTQLFAHENVTQENSANGVLNLNIQMLHGNPENDYNFNVMDPSLKKDWTQINYQFSLTSSGSNYVGKIIRAELIYNLPNGGLKIPLFPNNSNQINGSKFQLPHLYPMKISIRLESPSCVTNSGSICGLYETTIDENQSLTNLVNVEKYDSVAPDVINNVSTNLFIINH